MVLQVKESYINGTNYVNINNVWLNFPNWQREDGGVGMSYSRWMIPESWRDVLIQEETSIAEKNNKTFFPTKILSLIKNLITENQIFGLKIIILLLKLLKEIMKIMTQIMKKKGKARLKSIILKLFDVIQMILTFIFLNLSAK